MVAWKGMTPATPAECEYLERVRGLPCCLCLPDEQRTRTEAHHCKIGQKRISHWHTLPVCEWHHAVIHRCKQQEPTLVAQVHETLGITDKPWPASRILPRRVV